VSVDGVIQAPPVSLFGKVYARCYDRFMDRIDRDGAAEHRRCLVEEAGGEVLEIGAGTGKNLPLYRAAERVVALEPDPAMRARAHEAAWEAQVPVEVVEGNAVALPFPDASFDTVVFSLVLCTVLDLERTLAEARCVLRPGGTLRFYEHVRAADPHLARWQDRLERPWGWVGRGCHPNATRQRPWPQPGSVSYHSRSSTSRPCPPSSDHTLSGSRSIPQRERLFGNRRRLGWGLLSASMY
jgi:SAM-dependent methyltransferase